MVPPGFAGAVDELAIFNDILPSWLLREKVRVGLLSTRNAVLSTDVAGVSGGCQIVNRVPPDFVHSSCIVLLSQPRTAVLLSISPNLAVVGSVVTVRGTSFVSDVALMEVFVDGTLVPTVSATTTSVAFVLPELGGRRGPLKVSVMVVGLGKAIGELVVTSQVRLQSVSPDAGSFGGGTMISLNGTGFTSDLGAMRVVLSPTQTPPQEGSGIPCKVVSISGTVSLYTLVCVTSACPKLQYYVFIDVSAEPMPPQPQFLGFVCTSSTQCGFEATPRRTPVITGVTPTAGPVGTSLIIVGTG
jgi:hypothetical protein